MSATSLPAIVGGTDGKVIGASNITALTALSFDGVDDYAQVAYPVTNTTYTWTMKLKSNYANYSTLYRAAILSVRSGATGLNLCIRGATDTGGTMTAGGLAIFEGGAATVVTSQTLDPEVWYDVAVMSWEENGTGRHAIYLNGVLAVVGPGTKGTVARDNLSIGKLNGGTSSDNTYVSKITLADVRVYNRVLTAKEVEDTVKGTAPRNGLIIEALMNKDTGTVLKDTASNVDGAIYGAMWVPRL